MSWLSKKIKQAKRKLKGIKLKDVIKSDVIKGALSLVPGGSIVSKGIDVVGGWADKTKPLIAQVKDNIKDFGGDVIKASAEAGKKEVEKKLYPAQARSVSGWTSMTIKSSGVNKGGKKA